MKLITFDFWNTIFVDCDEDVRSQRRITSAFNILRRYNPELQRNRVENAFQVANTHFERQWQDLRASTMDTFVQTLAADLELPITSEDRERLVNFFESVLLEHPPALISRAAEAIHYVSSKASVGLICDTGYSPGNTLRRILKTHSLDAYFQAFSFSNETGFLKPSAECYWTILDTLKIRPNDALHIGDLELTDIKGAKELGMKAIKYIGSNPSAVPESMADAVISDLAELPELIDRFM